MKASKLLLPIAAIVGLYLFLAARAVSQLNYFINSVSLSFHNITPILTVQIGIQNVSNESFQIDSFVGNLVLDGGVIGTISSFATATITPASQTIYPIDIQLSLFGATADLISILQGASNTPKTISIIGNISASGIVAPVNLSYQIGN